MTELNLINCDVQTCVFNSLGHLCSLKYVHIKSAEKGALAVCDSFQPFEEEIQTETTRGIPMKIKVSRTAIEGKSIVGEKK
mgnify:CR=1 FL=1